MVIAGIGDMQRPAEKLSLTQNLCKYLKKKKGKHASKNGLIALMLTGLIWSRYSMVIIPKNYSLLAVNVFVFGTAGIQVGRIFK